MTVHDFDMARFLVGDEVEEVFCYGGCMVDPSIGEAGDMDTVTVLLKFKNGVQCAIDNRYAPVGIAVVVCCQRGIAPCVTVGLFACLHVSPVVKLCMATTSEWRHLAARVPHKRRTSTQTNASLAAPRACAAPIFHITSSWSATWQHTRY